MSPEEMFLSHLGLIEKIVDHQCRRYHFRREDAEDIASMVKLKLMDDDYAALRKFKRKSRVGTYLTVVVQRLICDHLNHIWGKRRHSTVAQDLGPVAERLEQLWVWDGIRLEEACEILLTNYGVTESRQELAAIARRLPPPRGSRRFEDDSALEALCSPDSSPEQKMQERERRELARRVIAALAEAVEELPAEERLIAKEIGLKVRYVEIASRLGIEQKRIYPRIKKVLKTLREALARKGFVRKDIAELLAGGAVELGEA
jgi:RNA polymerase sigma factor (sigma-70 family)